MLRPRSAKTGNARVSISNTLLIEKTSWGKAQDGTDAPPCYKTILLAYYFGAGVIIHAVGGNDDLFNIPFGGNAEHNIGHDTLHDASQASCANFHLNCLVGYRFESIGIVLKVNAVIAHECLILLGHGVLGLGKYADKILTLKGGQRSNDRQSADELGDDAET